jgi:putative holliday junction resolvase
MKALGIDYGRAKIGVAVVDFSPDYVGLAEPLKVIKVSNWTDALLKVKILVTEELVEALIIGISENEMGEEQQRFARELQDLLEIDIHTQDESLSTQDAQEMALSAGVPMKKRREMEDAFAAAIVLQSWLDTKRSSL